MDFSCSPLIIMPPLLGISMKGTAAQQMGEEIKKVLKDRSEMYCSIFRGSFLDFKQSLCHCKVLPGIAQCKINNNILLSAAGCWLLSSKSF